MNTFRGQIQKSIKQLSDLGYHDFQINSIIVDAISTNRLENLSTQQSQELLEVLKEYLYFAQKCRATNKSYSGKAPKERLLK